MIFVTPNCCAAVKESCAVHLSGTDTREQRPEWLVFAWNAEHEIRTRVPASFCPHCGTHLPDIRPRETQEKIQRVTDGGYYCDTCKERLISCDCKPACYAWEPVS